MTQNNLDETATSETEKKNIFRRAINKIEHFDDKHPIASSAIFGLAATAVLIPVVFYLDGKRQEVFAPGEEDQLISEGKI